MSDYLMTSSRPKRAYDVPEITGVRSQAEETLGLVWKFGNKVRGEISKEAYPLDATQWLREILAEGPQALPASVRREVWG